MRTSQRVIFFALGMTILLSATLDIVNVVAFVPYAAVWGDLGTWAQAVFTGGGLLFAGWSVLLAARQWRRAAVQDQVRLEEARDVARRGLVLRSAWIEKTHMPLRGGRITYEYEIANMSPFAVSNCKISVHMWTDANAKYYENAPDVDADDFFQAVVIGVLVPGEIARGKLVVRNPNAALGLWGDDRVANPDLAFTDAWGEHWLRPGTTRFRKFSFDLPQDAPECMCCGSLADSREYLGHRPQVQS